MIIPVVNVGGQYNHLITRVLVEVGAESELVPISITKKEIEKAKGLVIGGGPQRIASEIDKLTTLSALIREIEIPILGLCLAHQLIAIIFGGKAGPAKFPEYGPVKVFVKEKDDILKGFPKVFTAWASHNDEVLSLPKNFEILAYSKHCKVEVMKHVNKPIFGVQFHPEVSHTEHGKKMFENFVRICEDH